MKKYLLCISTTIIGLINAQQENVGVGTTSPDESAIIEIQSTEKGMLPPRMTQSERDAIINPANGLVLYNTTEGCLQINKGVKTAPLWECIGKSTIKNPSTWGSGVVEYGTPASCSAGLITGTMTVGSPLTNVNMLVYAKVVEAGTYEIATNPVNGIVFRGSGEFTASQVGQCIPVVLVGAGIPEQVGNFDFTLNTSPNETVSKNVEEVKITLVGVARYNGISPIYDLEHLKRGVGYNNEPVPASSTIEIKVETTGATTYNFTAQDERKGTGLIYSASGTFPIAGTYTVILHNNGVTMGEMFYGNLPMVLNGASNVIQISPRIDYKSMPVSQMTWSDLSFTADYDGNPNTPDTTKQWMDRNLGARTASYYAAYNIEQVGNYYQFGRPNDGHEIIVSDGEVVKPFNGFTYDRSPSTTPNTNKFIASTDKSKSWYGSGGSLPNDIWENENSPNNPCPSGYRLPTAQEYLALIRANFLSNAPGADVSGNDFLLAFGGYINTTANGNVTNNQYTKIWTSGVNSDGSSNSKSYTGGSGYNRIASNAQSHGFNVRCIKD